MIRIKVLDGIRASGKALIVGLPGMGGVAYTVANYFITSLRSVLVAELYSYSYPPQLGVSSGKASLIKAYLYDTPVALILTANAQPPSNESQNEFCDRVLEFLHSNGLNKVIATAAYVVSAIGTERAVYIAGNDTSIIDEFIRLGAQALGSGVISGINGAIVGWASYYDIPAAVLLAETWDAIVQLDEIDYRAAGRLVQIVGRYLGIEVDVKELDRLASSVEERVIDAISRSIKQQVAVKKGPESVM